MVDYDRTNPPRYKPTQRTPPDPQDPNDLLRRSALHNTVPTPQAPHLPSSSLPIPMQDEEDCWEWALLRQIRQQIVDQQQHVHLNARPSPNPLKQKHNSNATHKVKEMEKYKAYVVKMKIPKLQSSHKSKHRPESSTLLPHQFNDHLVADPVPQLSTIVQSHQYAQDVRFHPQCDPFRLFREQGRPPTNSSTKRHRNIKTSGKQRSRIDGRLGTSNGNRVSRARVESPRTQERANHMSRQHELRQGITSALSNKLQSIDSSSMARLESKLKNIRESMQPVQIKEKRTPLPYETSVKKKRRTKIVQEPETLKEILPIQNETDIRINEPVPVNQKENTAKKVRTTLYRSKLRNLEKQPKQHVAECASEQPLTQNRQIEKGISFKKKAAASPSPTRKMQPAPPQPPAVVAYSPPKVEHRKSGGDICLSSPPKVKASPLPLQKKRAALTPRNSRRTRKVLIFNSQDKYIARKLLALGWVVNPDLRSEFFHLRWVFKPVAAHYNRLKQGQFMNHVKNSQAITAKNMLHQNLINHRSSWAGMANHYPPSYDTAIISQKEDFIEEFIRDGMLGLLRRLYKLALTQRPQLTRESTQLYESLLTPDGYMSGSQPSPFASSQFRAMDMEDYRVYDHSFLIHINLTVIALKYWRRLRHQYQLQCPPKQHYHYLTFDQTEFDQNMNALEEYCRLGERAFEQTQSQNLMKAYFATPSTLMVQRIVKEYVFFRRWVGQRWDVLGQQQIWIVKPCAASRGSGIYLSNNWRDMVNNSRGIQSKVVQKYIERPLLFKTHPTFKNRKFDLRQWVLLRSVQPLQIYMFSHCYARVCPTAYNPNNINALHSHLTNYSFHKQHYAKNVKEESVIDYDTIVKLLLDEHQIDFESQVKPKMQEIIIETIKSSQQKLDDCGKRCFSLLGFDILLDQQCNPWLLEVNMSPACQERTHWLKHYLKQMGSYMLEIILPNQYLQMTPTKGPLPIVKLKTDISAEQEQEEGSPKLQRLDVVAPLLEEQKDEEETPQTPGASDENNESLGEWQIENVISGDPANQEQALQMLSIQGDDLLKLFTEEAEELQQVSHQQESQSGNMKLDFTKISQPDIKSQVKQDQFPTQELPEYDKLIPEASQPENQPEPAIEPKLMTQPSDPAPEVQPQGNPEPQVVSVYRFEWQLICSEDYRCPKREVEPFQLIATKIPTSAISNIDKHIDRFELHRKVFQQRISKVQVALRGFLQHRRKLNEPPLAPTRSIMLSINHSLSQRFIKETKSRSIKSALFNYEQKNIWHFNYQHSYANDEYQKVPLSRPITARLIKQSRISRDNSFRDKIKSIARSGTQPLNASHIRYQDEEPSPEKDRFTISEQYLAKT